jgi:hypothetical protein
MAVLGLVMLAQTGVAGSSYLADWCVSVNGNIAVACNGAGSGGGSTGVNLGSYDTTLEPSANTLGSITVTLPAGTNQSVAFYADYDVNWAGAGSFADVAATHGTRPAGTTYEAADPNTSNIFNEFSANALPNSNTVGTAGIPPDQCCDVSFALGLSGLGSGATVTFAVTDTAPTDGGFYIIQTNEIDGDSIYLEGINGGSPSPPSPVIPEPSTILLSVLGGGSLLAWKRFRAAR